MEPRDKKQPGVGTGRGTQTQPPATRQQGWQGCREDGHPAPGLPSQTPERRAGGETRTTWPMTASVLCLPAAQFLSPVP